MMEKIHSLNNYIVLILTLFFITVGLSSCDDSWLEPNPLSFHTPENTYVDADGFYAALTTCERNMRHEFFGDGSPILTEFILSDMAVEGTTDKAGPQMDLDGSHGPTTNCLCRISCKCSGQGVRHHGTCTGLPRST
jgi:hypothetical protein